ncbi:MauE/DoxX family redox-associated membrane protein [Chloroflexota bacterium]
MGQNVFLLEISSFILNPVVVNVISGALPWVEIVLGVCLLAGVLTQIVSGVSILLIASFIFHNSWMISQGLGYEPCSCLGVFEKLFGGKLSTTGSLYIDIGLLILALAVYFGYQGKLLNMRPWFLKRDKTANVSSDDSQDMDNG